MIGFRVVILRFCLYCLPQPEREPYSLTVIGVFGERGSPVLRMFSVWQMDVLSPRYTSFLLIMSVCKRMSVTGFFSDYLRRIPAESLP